MYAFNLDITKFNSTCCTHWLMTDTPWFWWALLSNPIWQDKIPAFCFYFKHSFQWSLLSRNCLLVDIECMEGFQAVGKGPRSPSQTDSPSTWVHHLINCLLPGHWRGVAKVTPIGHAHSHLHDITGAKHCSRKPCLTWTPSLLDTGD